MITKEISLVNVNVSYKETSIQFSEFLLCLLFCFFFCCCYQFKIILMPKRHIWGWHILLSFSGNPSFHAEPCLTLGKMKLFSLSVPVSHGFFSGFKRFILLYLNTSCLWLKEWRRAPCTAHLPTLFSSDQPTPL